MKITSTKISLEKGDSIKELQEVNRLIYQESDDKFFNNWEVFSNQERFMMRALKGIRKGDQEKIKLNLCIATSWFLAIMNRLHIDLEEAVWTRFPYLCSYCGSAPCMCKKIKPQKRPKITHDLGKKPQDLSEYQKMFEKIYPAKTRTLDHAGIHLAEEQGEISEAIQIFTGSHDNKYFQSIVEESADYFSCVMGVFNSAGIDFEKEMLEFFENNCHVCHKLPCSCDFTIIAEFKS